MRDRNLRHSDYRKSTPLRLLAAGGILLSAAFALLLGARLVPDFAQGYSESVYPLIVSSIGRFFGLFPFSVSEFGLYVLSAGILFAAIRWFRRPALLFPAIFFAAACLMFSYAACCGVNYYREPFSTYYIEAVSGRAGGLVAETGNGQAGNHFAETGNGQAGDYFAEIGSGQVGDYFAETGNGQAGDYFAGIGNGQAGSYFEETGSGQRGAEDSGEGMKSSGGRDSGGSYSPGEEEAKDSAGGDDDLKALCAWLADGLRAARGRLEENPDNYMDMQQKGVRAMEALAGEFPVLSGYYPRPKPVMLSWILSAQQYSGVYSPFAVEANYNRAMVSYNIPHTICHELSHLRGFMREDEANFIGYLACLKSEDADFNYSGYMIGWVYAGNELAKADREEYVRLYASLPEAVRMDLAENNAFWDRYEGRPAEAANKVNDAYLKINGQEEGVKTYGRCVDLMLLDFKSRVSEESS